MECLLPAPTTVSPETPAMTNTLMAILAYATLCAFLGILLYAVPRLDLGLVIGSTLLLAGYDFLIASRRRAR